MKGSGVRGQGSGAREEASLCEASPVNPSPPSLTERSSPAPNSAPAPRRILVVKLAGIGDLLQVTPCLDGLRRNYPNAHIAFLATVYTCEAIADHPLLDEVLVVENLGARGVLRDCVALLQLIGRLRSQGFDLAIVANKSRLLIGALRLAGIPLVVGFTYPGRWHLVHRGVPFTASRNILDQHLDLFALAGAARTPGRPFFKVPKEHLGPVADRLRSRGIQGVFLVSAPGGGTTPWVDGYAKRWEPEKYAELYDRVHSATGSPIVLLGGREDRHTIDSVRARAQAPLVDLGGQLDLGQSAAVIARASAYVGNDSALLYLAGAVGTPSVAVFGPTDPADYVRPESLVTVVRRQVPCSPCWNQLLGKKSPALTCDHVSCMKAVTVDDVYGALMPLLMVHASEPDGNGGKRGFGSNGTRETEQGKLPRSQRVR